MREVFSDWIMLWKQKTIPDAGSLLISARLCDFKYSNAHLGMLWSLHGIQL